MYVCFSFCVKVSQLTRASREINTARQPVAAVTALLGHDTVCSRYFKHLSLTTNAIYCHNLKTLLCDFFTLFVLVFEVNLKYEMQIIFTIRPSKEKCFVTF